MDAAIRVPGVCHRPCRSLRWRRLQRGRHSLFLVQLLVPSPSRPADEDKFFGEFLAILAGQSNRRRHQGFDTVFSSVSTHPEWPPPNVENLTLTGKAFLERRFGYAKAAAHVYHRRASFCLPQSVCHLHLGEWDLFVASNSFNRGARCDFTLI